MAGRASAARRVRPTLDDSALVIGAGIGAAFLLFMAAGTPGVLAPLSLATFALSVVMPAVGIAVLALLVPLREPPVFGALGLFVPLVGATVLGCVLRLPIDRPRRGIDPGTLLLLGYLAIIAVSLPPLLSDARSEEARSALARALQVGAGAGAFLAARAVLAHVDWRPYLALMVAGAALAASIGIAVSIAGASLSGPLEALASPAAVEVSSARATGPFTNPNYFGIYLATASVITVAAFRRLPKVAAPLVLLTLILVVVALFMTYSRAALLAAFVGFVAYAFLRDRRLGLAVGAVGLLAVTLVYPAFLAARLEQTYGNTSAAAYQAEELSTESRARIAETGLRLWQREPVFGIGFGLFQFESPRFQGSSPITFAHNWYVEVLAEQGIVGVAMVVGIGSALTIGLWRSRHPMRDPAIAVLATLLVGFLAIEGPALLQATGIAWLAFAIALSRPPAETAMPIVARTRRHRPLRLPTPA